MQSIYITKLTPSFLQTKFMVLFEVKKVCFQKCFVSNNALHPNLRSCANYYNWYKWLAKWNKEPVAVLLSLSLSLSVSFCLSLSFSPPLLSVCQLSVCFSLSFSITHNHTQSHTHHLGIELQRMSYHQNGY